MKAILVAAIVAAFGTVGVVCVETSVHEAECRARAQFMNAGK